MEAAAEVPVEEVAEAPPAEDTLDSAIAELEAAVTDLEESSEEVIAE